jgi:hypothetical protein
VGIGYTDTGGYKLAVYGAGWFSHNLVVNSGKVGIGTSYPQSALHVASGYIQIPKNDFVNNSLTKIHHVCYCKYSSFC